jgi:putative transposase
MSLPRAVFPGRFLFITRRCTQRQYLLRPDDDANNAFIYCLAEAAKLFGMIVIGSQMMSNHHHTIVYDPYGNEVAFRERFHKLLAKCLNVLRGHEEHFWSSEEPCVVELLTPEDVLAKLIYTAINPVKDNLVDQVHQWPGPNFLRALLKGEPLKAHRPRYFFDPDGDMPDAVELELKLPDDFKGNKDALLEDLRRAIPLVEHHYRTQRLARGGHVLGRRRVMEQDPSHKPNTPKPQQGLRPRYACRFTWLRIAALQRYALWQHEYRDAFKALQRGERKVFPYGTYWLKRVANVPVRPAPAEDPQLS